MDQRTRPRPGNLRGALVPAGIVSTAAAGSATAHVVAAAAGPVGAMTWWMAAMGVACLACAAPLVPGRFYARLAFGRMAGGAGGQPAACAAGRSAGHLLVMSALMILIHLVLVLWPGAASHHSTAEAAGTAAHHVQLPGQSMGHDAMLALMAVEMVSLMGASAALRLARRRPSASFDAAAPAAVGP